MKEKTMIDAKNIIFEYANGLVPDSKREHSMINGINNWFGEVAELINSQAGTIVVYFQDNINNRVHFDGMGNDLEATLLKKLEANRPKRNPGM